MGLLKHIQLTPQKNLLTDVENRSVYNLNNCELNVFETYRKSQQVQLTFHDLVITSMVRGKKIMHMPNDQHFEYYPGETVLAPASTNMVIDFPEAKKKNPTQCIALTLDSKRIQETIDYLNEHYPKAALNTNWNIDFQLTHLKNSADLAAVVNKMVGICMKKDITKDVLADLTMKELIVRIIQLQHLYHLDTHDYTNNNDPLLHVSNYIRANLSDKLDIDGLSKKACMSRAQFFRTFKREYGITPVQYIIRERLKRSKVLLADTRQTIQQVSIETGFDDVNNFIKLFKKNEGLTPGAYRDKLVS